MKSTIVGGLSLYGVLAPSKAKAQATGNVYSWTGASGGLWSVGSNWSNTSFPLDVVTATGTTNAVVDLSSLATLPTINDLPDSYLNAINVATGGLKTIGVTGNNASTIHFLGNGVGGPTINVGVTTGTVTACLTIQSAATIAAGVDLTIQRFGTITGVAAPTVTFGTSNTGNATITGASSRFVVLGNLTVNVNGPTDVLGIVQGDLGVTTGTTTFTGPVAVGASGLLVRAGQLRFFNNGTSTNSVAINGHALVEGGTFTVMNSCLSIAGDLPIYAGLAGALGGTGNFGINSTLATVVAGAVTIGNATSNGTLNLQGEFSLGTNVKAVTLANGILTLNSGAFNANGNAAQYALNVILSGNTPHTINVGRSAITSANVSHTINSLSVGNGSALTTTLTNVNAGFGYSLAATAGTTFNGGTSALTVNAGNATATSNIYSILNLGAVSENAPTALNKLGTGTLIIGSGGVTGGITINAGSVQFNGDLASSGMPASSIVVSSGISFAGGGAGIAAGLASGKVNASSNGAVALFLPTFTGTFSDAVDLSGYPLMSLGAQFGHSVTYDGAYTPATAGILRFGGGGGNLTVSSNIGGANTVVIGGQAGVLGGNVTLTGTNSYTGGTVIAGSILNVFSNSDLGTSLTSINSNVTLAGGNLAYKVGGNSTIQNLNLTANSFLIIDTPNLANTTTPNLTINHFSSDGPGSRTLTVLSPAANSTGGFRFNINELDLNSAVVANFTVGVNNSVPTVINVGSVQQTIPAAASLTFQSVGAAGSVLPGGGVLVNLNDTISLGGILTIGNNTTASLQVENPFDPLLPAGINLSTAASRLRLNGFNATVGTLSAGVAGAVLTNDGVDDSTLTFVQATAANLTFSITDGTNGGSLSVVKFGPGIANITSALGCNTYTGTTTVAGGMLMLGRNTGGLSCTTGVIVSGLGSILQIGESASTSQLQVPTVSNRINTAATLTLGGAGDGQLIPVLGNQAGGISQSFAGFHSGVGVGRILPLAAANITPTAFTLTFNGTLTRDPGGVIEVTSLPLFNIQAGTAFTASGNNAVFISGGNRLLIGGVQDPTLPNATLLTVPTTGGSNFGNAVYAGNWSGTGSNTDVTSTGGSVAPAGLTTDALRFSGNLVSPLVYDLAAGTSTISSGMILFANTTGAFSTTIGDATRTLRSDGADLIVMQNRVSAPSIIDAVISDNSGATPTGLTKSGAGNLVITAQNTYTGPTSILAGVLEVRSVSNGGSPSSLGASSSAASNLILNNNSTLRYVATPGSGSAATDRLLTIAAGNTTIDSSSLAATDTLSFTNGGNLAYLGLGNRTLTFTGNNTGTNGFALDIHDATNFVSGGTGPGFVSPSLVVSTTSVTKTGGGTWVLSGNNTYTGNTTLVGTLLALGGGVLQIESDSALGGQNITYSVSNATLRYGNSAITLAGKNVFLNSTAFMDTNGLDVTISPTFFGTGTFNKTGAGTLKLAPGTQLTQGISFNVLGGSLDLNVSGANQTFATIVATAGELRGNIGTLTATGSVTMNAGGALTDIGTIVVTGASGIRLHSAGIVSNVATIQASLANLTGATGTGTLFANIIDPTAGIGNVIKTEAGNWVLAGINTYTGNTSINAGTLGITSIAALGQTSDVRFTGNTATLQFAGNGITLPANLPLSHTLVSGTYNFDVVAGNQAFIATTIPANGINGFNKVGGGNLTILSTLPSLMRAVAILDGRLDLNNNVSNLTSNTSITANGTLANLAGQVITPTLTVNVGGAVLDVGGISNGATNTTIVANGTIANFVNMAASTLVVGNFGLVQGPGNITTATTLTVNANVVDGDLGAIQNIGNITVGSTLTSAGSITDIGNIAVATTLTNTGEMRTINRITAGTSVVLAGNGSISNVAEGLFTPTLTVGNFTLLANIGGAGIANLPGGGNATAAAVVANGTIANFTNIDASTLTVGAFGSIVGPGNISTLTTLTVNSLPANSTFGTISNVGNIAVGSTLTTAGAIQNVNRITAGTSVVLTSLSNASISNVAEGLLTPTLTVGNLTLVEDVRGPGIALITTLTNAGIVRDITQISAGTSVVLTAASNASISNVTNGIFTPTLTVGNFTLVENIGGAGIANLPGGGNATAATVVANGTIANFTNIDASTLTVGAFGSIVGPGNISTLTTLIVNSLPANSTFGTITNVGNLAVGSTITTAGVLENIDQITAGTSITLTLATDAAIRNVANGIRTPTLVVGNGTEVENVGGIRSLIGNLTGLAVTANGTIANFTTMEAAGLTVNFLGIVRGPGNITTTGAIAVNANTTDGGLIEDVHDIAGGSSLTIGGTVRDVTGTITTATTFALNAGGTLSNVAVGGLIAGTTATIAGNVSNVAVLSGTTVTVNNLGSITGTGNVEARTGNLTVNAGGLINVDGTITAATNALILANASVAATGNVTFGSGLFLGRADANNVSPVAGTLTIGENASLLVGNGIPADVRIGENTVGNAGGPAIGILDASRASSVNMTALNFSLGQANANLVETYGHLILPTTAGANTLITTTGTNTFRVGVAIPVLGPNSTAQDVFGTGTYGSVVDLGNQTVTIVTSALNIAAAKASGTMRFNGTGGNLTINNGTTATAFNLAVNANTTAHDSQIVGWFDTRGGSLNANFGAVVLGSVAAAPSGNISAQATFILDGATSNVTAASIVMGRSLLVAPNDAISDTYGNLTILNGAFTVTGSLATSTGGSIATPTLVNLQGGTLSIGTTVNFGNGVARIAVDGGNLLLGTGSIIGNLAGTSDLVVAAGLLNANDRNLGNAAVPLSSIGFTGGTILNANVIAVTGGLAQSGGTLQRNAGNTTTVINGYVLNGGNAIIDGGLTVTGGPGITVNGGTLKGTGTATITAQPLVVNSGGTLAPGGSTGTLTVAGASGITIAGTLAIDFVNVGTGLNAFSPNGESSATSNQSLLNATGASFNLDLTGANIAITSSNPVPTGSFYSWVITALPAGSTVSNEVGGGLIDRSTYTIDTTHFAVGQYSGSTDDMNFSLYHTGNSIVLASTAPVPEPLGMTLIGGLGLGVIGWVRRRNQRNRR